MEYELKLAWWEEPLGKILAFAYSCLKPLVHIGLITAVVGVVGSEFRAPEWVHFSYLLFMVSLACSLIGLSLIIIAHIMNALGHNGRF